MTAALILLAVNWALLPFVVRRNTAQQRREFENAVKAEVRAAIAQHEQHRERVLADQAEIRRRGEEFDRSIARGVRPDGEGSGYERRLLAQPRLGRRDQSP